MAARAVGRGPKRGEIWLVNFDPTVGAEIRKTRPAVILQNDVANRWSPITIVAAMTSRFDEPLYPTEVRVRPPEGGLSQDGVILLNQIRSIDQARLVKRLGALKPGTVERMNLALQVSVGLIGV